MTVTADEVSTYLSRQGVYSCYAEKAGDFVRVTMPSTYDWRVADREDSMFQIVARLLRAQYIVREELTEFIVKQHKHRVEEKTVVTEAQVRGWLDRNGWTDLDIDPTVGSIQVRVPDHRMGSLRVIGAKLNQDFVIEQRSYGFLVSEARNSDSWRNALHAELTDLAASLDQHVTRVDALAGLSELGLKLMRGELD